MKTQALASLFIGQTNPTVKAPINFNVIMPKINFPHPFRWSGGVQNTPTEFRFLYPLVVIYPHFISRATEVESYYSPAAVKVETMKATKSPKTKLLSNNHEPLSFIHTTLIIPPLPLSSIQHCWHAIFHSGTLKSIHQTARYLNTQYKPFVLNWGAKKYSITTEKQHCHDTFITVKTFPKKKWPPNTTSPPYATQ